MLEDFLKHIQAVQMIRSLPPENKILAVSGILEDWWGYTSAEAMGRDYTDWISSLDQAFWNKELQEKLEENKHLITHYRVNTPNHQNLWVREQSNLINNDGQSYIQSLISPASEAYIEQLIDAEKYQAVANLSSEAIVIHENYNILDVNETFEKMFKIPRSEVIGQDIIPHIIPPESMPKVQSLVGVLEKNPQESYAFELLVCKKDGTPFWAKMKGGSIQVMGRELRVMSFTDLSAIKATTSALSSSNERYKKMTEASMEGIIIHDKGIIVEVNPKIGEILGYPIEKMIGKPLLDFIPKKEQARIQTFLQENEDNPTIKRNATFAFRNYLNQELFINILGSALEIEGKTYRYVIVRDISEEYRAQKSLKNNQERYKHLSELTKELIMIHNLDGRILEVNKAFCEFTGLQEEEILQKYTIDFLSSEVIEKHQLSLESLSQHYRQKPKSSGIYTMLNRNGENRILEFHEEAFRRSEQELRYVVMTDITDMHQAQKHLEESLNKYKMLSDITQEAIIIHQNRKILEVNRRASELLGWLEEELIHQDLDDLIHPQTLPQVQYPLSQDNQFHRVYLQKSNRESFVAELLEGKLNSELHYLVIRDISAQIKYEQRIEELFYDLSEKNKQLNCLFELARLSSNKAISMDQLMEEALNIIPMSWQHSELCAAKITYGNKQWATENYRDTEWALEADIKTNGQKQGILKVCYLNLCPIADHGPFLDAELELIEAIGLQLSTLIEKKLSEDKMIASVLEAEDRERTRIAKELHDSLGQLLMAISLNLESLKKDMEVLSPKNQTKLSNALNYLNTAILESRHISHNLMPKAINDYGYVLAVQSMIEGLETIEEVNFHFYNNLKESRLAPNLELSLFRITQEAITNILKHAEAENITIQLMKYPDMLLLTIEDDGKGFDFNDKMTRNRSFGLESIQNRANSISAILTLESKKGHGTTIMVEVPL